jgi:nucleoside-diphosphate-sugar epimerase
VDLAAYQATDVERLWSVPGASLGRAVMISSGQVYLVTAASRRSHREPDSRRSVMREPPVESPEHGQWSYGVGKRAAEAALLALRRRHGVRAVILRLPVVQGEDDPTLRLWAWLERMLDGGPVPLPAGGRRDTRFVEVTDVARLIERMAGGQWPALAVYNLAAERRTSLRDFLELAARAAGVEPVFVAAPMSRFVAAGLDPTAWPYSHRWSSVLDPTRARRDLDFAGTMPADYLPRVVRWHLEHRPAGSHRGYTQRGREREVCARMLAAREA